MRALSPAKNCGEKAIKPFSSGSKYNSVVMTFPLSRINWGISTRPESCFVSYINESFASAEHLVPLIEKSVSSAFSSSPKSDRESSAAPGNIASGIKAFVSETKLSVLSLKLHFTIVSVSKDSPVIDFLGFYKSSYNATKACKALKYRIFHWFHKHVTVRNSL